MPSKSSYVNSYFPLMLWQPFISKSNPKSSHFSRQKPPLLSKVKLPVGWEGGAVLGWSTWGGVFWDVQVVCCHVVLICFDNVYIIYVCSFFQCLWSTFDCENVCKVLTYTLPPDDFSDANAWITFTDGIFWALSSYRQYP